MYVLFVHGLNPSSEPHVRAGIYRGVEGGENNLLTQDTQDERHSYEKCQYEEFKLRVAKMNELRESKDGARSN